MPVYSNSCLKASLTILEKPNDQMISYEQALGRIDKLIEEFQFNRKRPNIAAVETKGNDLQ